MNKRMICDVCKELIDPDDDYHCGPIDEFYHEECCPDCQAEEADANDTVWREFLANEYASEAAESLGV